MSLEKFITNNSDEILNEVNIYFKVDRPIISSTDKHIVKSNREVPENTEKTDYKEKKREYQEGIRDKALSTIRRWGLS